MKKIVCFLLCLVFLPVLSSCKKDSESRNLVNLYLTFNEDMTVDGVMEYVFTSPENDLSTCVFNLYPNAFKGSSPVYESDFLSAYPNGFSKGYIDILSVKEGGEKASFTVNGINEQTLTVFLTKQLKKGEKSSVYIEFRTVLPNAYHRFGYGDDTVNLSGFYPTPCIYENGEFIVNAYYPAGDPFYSECKDYVVTLSVPSAYSVASSLTPTGTVWSGGETEYSYERKNVREIAFVLSKKFEIAKCDHNGVEISYYYYDDENPEKTLETAKQSLEYYSNEYYKYPYGEYVVCEGDFLYGGMEYPCLSLISDSAYSERDYVVAHETAHQWFYGIVGVNQSEIGYLDEGLTEYLTISFLSDRGDGDYGEYVKTAKREYLDVKNALLYQGVTTPPVMERNLKDFSSEAEYVMIAYKRSLIAIDGLKGYVGDKKFKKALKKFVSEKAFSNATTDDFISVFDKKKRGAGKFFKDFVQGKAEVIY